MGTSGRNTSKKIKQLLGKMKSEQPDIKISDVIPDIVGATLKAKITKNYLGDKDFSTFVGSGVATFKSASKHGYDEFIQGFDINPDNVGEIEREKIINAILDDIEEKNGEIESELLLSAFRSAVTEMLINKSVDPYQFLVRFCEIFIIMIVREEASESLHEAFLSTDNDEMQNPIEQFAKDYVKKSFSTIIEDYISGKISVSELIKKLSSLL